MGQDVTDFIKNNGDTIGLASDAVGAGLNAFGKVSAGNAASGGGYYQASIYQLNAQQAAQAAQDAIQNGIVAGQTNQIKISQTIADQQATFAAHGVQINQDSPLQRATDATRIGKVDEQTIYNNAAKTALVYKMQGINYQNQANLAIQRGQAAQEAGYIGGVGSLISGAGKVASKWAVLANSDKASPLVTRTAIQNDPYNNPNNDF